MPGRLSARSARRRSLGLAVGRGCHPRSPAGSAAQRDAPARARAPPPRRAPPRGSPRGPSTKRMPEGYAGEPADPYRVGLLGPAFPGFHVAPRFGDVGTGARVDPSVVHEPAEVERQMTGAPPPSTSRPPGGSPTAATSTACAPSRSCSWCSSTPASASFPAATSASTSLRDLRLPHHRAARRRAREQWPHLAVGVRPTRPAPAAVLDAGARRRRDHHHRVILPPSPTSRSPATSAPRRCGCRTGTSPPARRST